MNKKKKFINSSLILLLLIPRRRIGCQVSHPLLERTVASSEGITVANPYVTISIPSVIGGGGTCSTPPCPKLVDPPTSGSMEDISVSSAASLVAPKMGICLYPILPKCLKNGF